MSNNEYVTRALTDFSRAKEISHLRELEFPGDVNMEYADILFEKSIDTLTIEGLTYNEETGGWISSG